MSRRAESDPACARDKNLCRCVGRSRITRSEALLIGIVEIARMFLLCSRRRRHPPAPPAHLLAARARRSTAPTSPNKKRRCMLAVHPCHHPLRERETRADSTPSSRPSRRRRATGRKHWSRDLPLRLKLLQHNAVCSIVEPRSHYNVYQGPLPAKRKSLEGMAAAILAKV
jgi:hypothetical protein